jgi:hypothetical protein
MTEQEMEVVITDIVKGILLEKRFPFGVPQKGIGNKKATGNLINSIKAKNVIISENMETISFDLDAMNYLINVDKGRGTNKTPPPIWAIMNWIKSKGINIRDEKGRFVKGNIMNNANKQKKLAFAISKKIGKFGVRATNIGSIAITEIENDPRFFDLYQNEAFDKLDDKIKLD